MFVAVFIVKREWIDKDISRIDKDISRIKYIYIYIFDLILLQHIFFLAYNFYTYAYMYMSCISVLECTCEHYIQVSRKNKETWGFVTGRTLLFLSKEPQILRGFIYSLKFINSYMMYPGDQ